MMRKMKQKLKIVIVLLIVNVIALGYLVFIRTQNKQPQEPQVAENAAAIINGANVHMPEIMPTPTTDVIIDETPVNLVDIDTDTSITRLVNKDHPISADYVPDLVTPDVTMYNTQQVRREAAEPLKQMFDAAKADGVNLMLISGYRSYTEQQSLWYTYEEKKGRAYANSIDAIPGMSEHQLGLGFDLGYADGTCQLKSCFHGTKADTWLKENAYKYGFIQRYPYGKEKVTGYTYAAWHYRYLGVTEATMLYNSGKTMEEQYLPIE